MRQVNSEQLIINSWSFGGGTAMMLLFMFSGGEIGVAVVIKRFGSTGRVGRDYAFLTTEPNAEVGAIHPKATPVILMTPDEVETWMTGPPEEAPRDRSFFPLVEFRDAAMWFARRGYMVVATTPRQTGISQPPMLASNSSTSTPQSE